MDPREKLLMLISIPVVVASILTFVGSCIWIMLRRRQMKKYNQFVRQEYADRGQQTSPLILRIQNEYIEKYNRASRTWVGRVFWLRAYPHLAPGNEEIPTSTSTPEPEFKIKLQDEAEEKQWKRIANTIIGWIGIALIAGLLILTAGVDLYQDHFNLFVTFMCAIPLFFIVNKWFDRAQKRAESNSLRVVNGFELSEEKISQRKRNSYPQPRPYAAASCSLKPLTSSRVQSAKTSSLVVSKRHNHHLHNHIQPRKTGSATNTRKL